MDLLKIRPKAVLGTPMHTYLQYNALSPISLPPPLSLCISFQNLMAYNDTHLIISQFHWVRIPGATQRVAF